MLDLATLNPQQREAVTHLEGPLLLLAGAGSGKTRVITCRIAHLLSQGVPSRSILAVTFTNKAAREMRERVAELVGRNGGGMTIATFHALCLRILKAHIERLGFKRNFSVYGAADQQRLVRELLREINPESSPAEAEQILWRIGAAKNRLITSDNYTVNPNDPFSALCARLYPRYQQALKAYNAVDFDDLLLLANRLLEQFPPLLEQYQQHFQYQMVDEYQDTNPAQYNLLKLLAGSHRNLCVVGDDDQSIYAFRGAEVANILDFEQDFPGTRIIKLEQNYRSSGHILAAANAVIKHNSRRRDKALWTSSGDGTQVGYLLCDDGEDEARQVCERILSASFRDKRPYRDFAILYRTNSQSRSFEEQLRAHNLPYVLIGGQQFFDRKEVRDVIAYLRVIQNPADEVSLLRVLNYPRRGIGTQSIDQIIRYSTEHQQPIWNLLGNSRAISAVNDRTRSAIDDFVILIKNFRQRFRQPHDMLEVLRDLLRQLGLADEIYRQEKDPQVAKRRVDNQDEILNSMATYLERSPRPSLAGFLERVSLNDDEVADQNDRDADPDLDVVTLMSLHSSKGLEFPVVFLTGLEEGFLPHRRSLSEQTATDEERRLCYVGITRAQQQLFLLGARQRRKHGRLEQREPSRFLNEIPESVLQRSTSQQPETSSPQEQAASANDFFANINQMLGK